MIIWPLFTVIFACSGTRSFRMMPSSSRNEDASYTPSGMVETTLRHLASVSSKIRLMAASIVSRPNFLNSSSSLRIASRHAAICERMSPSEDSGKRMLSYRTLCSTLLSLPAS